MTFSNPQAVVAPATSRRSAGDLWLSALTYWYLTGLLAVLAFSFGLYLVRLGPHARAPQDLLDAFTWQNGHWYKQIAVEGYHYNPRDQSNVAFFPVYPLLGRGVMIATGLRAEAALLIVSNLSLLAALALLAFYVRDRYPDAPEELTDYTVLTAALFPTGCFFRFAYSESTFLFLAILAMYAMLRRWPLWAIALVVGLATAARPVGIALLAPFAIHIVRRSSSPSERGRVSESAVKETDTLRWRPASELARLALYVPLACWGLVAFTAYQSVAFGDPFATARVQKNWGTPAAWRDKALALATLEPIQSVYDPKSTAFWPRIDEHGIPWFSLQFANPVLFVGATAVIAVGALLSLRNWIREKAGADCLLGTLCERTTRDPPSRTKSVGERAMSTRWLSMEEASLAAMLLLIPYVTRAYEMGMGSMGRFVAVAFPIYLVLGQILVRLPGALRTALLALAGFFLAASTALYAARYLIF